MRTLLLVTIAGLLVGCSHIGESTAEKPDPAQFMPKNGAPAGGPPPTTPPTGS